MILARKENWLGKTSQTLMESNGFYASEGMNGRNYWFKVAVGSMPWTYSFISNFDGESS